MPPPITQFVIYSPLPTIYHHFPLKKTSARNMRRTAGEALLDHIGTYIRRGRGRWKILRFHLNPSCSVPCRSCMSFMTSRFYFGDRLLVRLETGLENLRQNLCSICPTCILFRVTTLPAGLWSGWADRSWRSCARREMPGLGGAVGLENRDLNVDRAWASPPLPPHLAILRPMLGGAHRVVLRSVILCSHGNAHEQTGRPSELTNAWACTPVQQAS